MSPMMAILGVLVLAATAYLAALHLAILQASVSVLQKRLVGNGRARDAEWIAPRLPMLAQAVALLRTSGRVAFFALLLAEMVGIGESVPLTWGRLVGSAAVSTVVLWLVTSVMASAIAEHATEGIVIRSMPALRLVQGLAIPLNWICRVIDEAMRRLTGANLQPEDPEDELLASIEDTQREGGLDEVAAALLENVVEFTSTVVSEVMTPRTDIEGISYTDDLSAIRAFISEAGHSRVPVYRENLDSILGILYVKDLIPYLGEEPGDFRLLPLLRQPIRVPETKPVRELLKDFQRSEVHLALVVDEYGGTAGLVTIEDVLEEIVGEIRDEHEPDDEDEPTLDRIAPDLVEVDGRFRIDELNEILGLELPDEAYDTVAGLVLAHLGRVPTAAETFRIGTLSVEVLEATPTQVRRIRVRLPSADQEPREREPTSEAARQPS
ncbi:MAG: HlyC/CorC family transporter [Phycisphaerales bacterium]|nr:HlyC/CorC family transporter [Phycisphaerales bacterium]